MAGNKARYLGVARAGRQLRAERTVMPTTDLCFLNVMELARLVRTRKISPVEVVRALLSRIDALNDNLLAYLHVSATSAMAAAQAAEIEIGNGGYSGPLHGIP